MEQDYTLHAHALTRDIDCEVYGTAGAPLIVFPEATGSCSSWNNNGMVEALSDLCESARIQLFCVDSVDASSWYFKEGDKTYRKTVLDQYFSFLMDEFVPFVASINPGIPIVAGAGIGALNATCAMLTHPEKFGGLLALSGTYTLEDMADTRALAAYAPLNLVNKLTLEQKLQLAPRHLAFVCGTGESETGCVSQHTLQESLEAAGISAFFEYWGHDVGHSWMWWQEMAQELIPCLLTSDGLAERRRTSAQARSRALVTDAQKVLEEAKTAEVSARSVVAEAKRLCDAAQQHLSDTTAETARCDTTAHTLQARANELWHEKARLEQLVQEAHARAQAAQDKADAAKHAHADAKWYQGEAQAAATDAAHKLEEAEALLSEKHSVSARAQHAFERAQAALKSARAEASI